MPSANLDLVRSIYAACECGDFSSVEWAHPEIERPWRRWTRTRTGLAATAEGWCDLLSARDDFGADARECRELDDGGEDR